MKKAILALTLCAAAITAGNTSVTKAEEFTYSNTEVCTNISGDFYSSDVYRYSSDDTKHNVVFRIGSDKAYVDGSVITLDAAPYINQSRTMIPLRAVADIFGEFGGNINVSWNSADKKAIVICNSREVVFTIGNNEYTIDGKKMSMSGGTAEIKNGRICVPVRVLSEALELKTNWDSATGTITITN